MGNKFTKATLNKSKENQNELLTIRYCNDSFNIISLQITTLPTQNIGSLALSDCCIGMKGSKILIQSKWTNLKNLSLTENQLGNEGVKMLVKSSMPNLKNLNLLKNRLTSASCRYLVNANWKNISNITFNQQRYTDDTNKITNKMTIHGIDQLRKIAINNFYQIQQIQKRINHMF